MFHGSVMGKIVTPINVSDEKRPSGNTRRRATYTVCTGKDGYGKNNPVYGYCSTIMLRYYTVNFYMGDCVINCEKEENLPKSGILIIGENDLQEWAERHKENYDFSILRHTGHKSCDSKQQVIILKIVRKS